ncbi:MAG: AI-2E family transporter [Serpentinimonas sp.]|nr:AI-2E family transporter [Serpentinimonas sp.]
MLLTPSQLRVLAWVGLAVVAWLLLGLLAPVLTPFLVAAVLAYVLHPAVERLHQHGLPRWLGAGLALTLLVLVLLAVLLLIVPVITHQVPLLRDQIPLLLERFNVWVAPWATRLDLDLQIDVAMVREQLQRLITGDEGRWVEYLLSSLRIGGSALLAVLGFLVLTPIAAFYLLLDWDWLVENVKLLVPPRWRTSTQGFLDETDQVLGQYLRGQLLVMSSMAVFFTVGLMLVGLDLALPIGVFTGMAMFVPFLGFGVGMVLGLLAALLQFGTLWGVLLVGAVFMLGQVLESMYLTPRVLGGRIGMHPIAVIFALMAFGHLFGFVGVLIALPVSAVLVVALRRLQALYQSSALYTDGMVPTLPAAAAAPASATPPPASALAPAERAAGNPPA